MIRRIIDLTQTISPTNDYQHDYPPPWSDFEATGPERTRVELQKLARVEPFHLDGHHDELMMNVTIGHSTGDGHTHVDCFIHDWETMRQDVPKEIRWTQRDISQVPSHELIGPAAMVDISEVAPFGEITLDFFKEKASHIQPGDMVFIKSGHPSLVREGKYKTGDFTVIPPEVAVWMATEKQVRVCGFDHKINGNFAAWSRTERTFYRHGVLMIDKMANLDELDCSVRYFCNIGLSCKMKGVDDSPARVFVINKLTGLIHGGKTQDLFFPIDCPEAQGKYPYPRTEPYVKKDQIRSRFHLANMHMTQSEYKDVFGGPGFIGFKRFTNSIGTHLQVPSCHMSGMEAKSEYDLSCIATDKLWGRCVIVDAWAAGPGQNVTVAMLEQSKGRISEGAIVLIRTAYADYYAKHPEYSRYSPGISDEAIKWLTDKNIKMIITDFASVENAKAHCCIGEHDHLKYLFNHGILVVNNAYSIWRINQPECVAFVSPMAFPGLNASPCRVLIYEEYGQGVNP